MSDLQCPARFLVLAVTSPGEAAATAEGLRHERVAAVYDGPPGTGAAPLGPALGLPSQALAEELRLDDVLAHEVDALAALSDLADLHRGETVVVTGRGRPGQRVDVSVDGDGVSVVEVSPGDAT